MATQKMLDAQKNIQRLPVVAALVTFGALLGICAAALIAAWFVTHSQAREPIAVIAVLILFVSLWGIGALKS